MLFLGTTGLDKSNLLEKIADHACKEKYGLSSGIKHDSAPNYLQIFDVDKRIRENLMSGYPSFMDGYVKETQITIWKKELKEILGEIEKTNPKNVFLSTHAVYYRYNNYFSMIDQNTLSKFKPDIIITLIDDIYDISDRVTTKEKQYNTNSSCNLSEALGWRTVETLMADYLSENLFLKVESAGITPEIIKSVPIEIKNFFGTKIPHYVLGVKHNVQTFYRLLFERKRLVLYSSFPITSTRTNKDNLAEISNFKEKLNKEYIVLDPATIDEILLKKKSDMKKGEYEALKKNNLIHMEDEQVVVLKRLFGNYSRSTELPGTLKIGDLVTIKDVIMKQVEKRDYQMVHQSDGVVAYRPFWGGRPDPAGGVDQELKWAISLNKGALAFHPTNEDGDPKQMFTGIENALKYEKQDALFEQLKAMQTEKTTKMNSLSETWE